MPRDVLDRLDRAHLVHGFGSPAVAQRDGTMRIVRGKGIHVWDADGRRYVDGLSGLWNVAVGHGRVEIARAIARQARVLAYAPTLLGFTTEPAVRLAARIAKLLPPVLGHVVFTSGGSESNESVIRYVRAYNRLRGKPDKIGIVALTNAYHGTTTGAASLTGLATFHCGFEPMLPEALRMARPHCYRCELGLTYPSCALACADELERIVAREGADRIGAVVVEPIQGVGGVIVPPAGWLERIRAIADRHDLLLVVDEVITGFGRTGKWFGFEHWDVVPDILVFAKGVTSGYQPLGGVVLHDRVFRTFVEAGPHFALHHGFTYSGHPVACAAGLATLDILERERLVTGVAKKAPHFRQALDTLKASPIVGDVRAIGLMAAVEIVADCATRQSFPSEARVPFRIRDAALRRGLICRAGADAVMLCPPLVTTTAEIDELVAMLDATLRDVAADLDAA
jgi:adenosylmethionine-8-amino-7-oxononanoate aminotransferase